MTYEFQSECSDYLYVRGISLYVVFISRTSFRVNPNSIVSWNDKELLAGNKRHICSLIDSKKIQTHKNFAYKRTLNHLVKLDR